MKKKPSPLLVVVDMQNYFTASENKDVQEAIIREINRFKNKNHPIVVLECMDCGRTRKDIRESLYEYENVFWEMKEQDDGSPEVFEIIQKNGLKISEIMICGVNTCICVEQTMYGLSRLMRKVPVHMIEDGCACDCSFCNSLKE